MIESRETLLSPARIGVRIAPMLAVAWTRTYAVVLPGIMHTFAMTPSEGGRFIATIEGGSFLSLLVLGLAIERIGAVRVLLIGLPAVAIALMAMTSVPSPVLLLPILLLLGSGMAWTATSINTVMATTGKRRSLYLGLMHTTYSAFAVMAPLIAAWVLARYSWQTWYRGVSVLAIGFTFLIWKFEVSTSHDRPAPSELPPEQPKSLQMGPSVVAIGTICLGISALAGIQGIFNAWSYLYIKNVYAVRSEFATFGPTCFWIGILVGRFSFVWLAGRYSARTLLIVSSLVPSVAMGAERLFSSPWIALFGMGMVGIGVSGSYQLGTQWAAERLPHRVGTASTAVMALAWLGIGCWPWVAGILIEMTSYAWLVSLVFCCSLVALLAFLATPQQTKSET